MPQLTLFLLLDVECIVYKQLTYRIGTADFMLALAMILCHNILIFV